MNQAVPERSVVVEREFAHPPARLWRALTLGALMEEWLLPNDFEPVVGHRFKLRSPPLPQWDGVIDCEVREVQPTTALAYSWSSLGVETVVRFTLTPTPRGVLLRMEQAGRFPAEANYRGAQYGWQNFLGKLDAVLEKQA